MVSFQICLIELSERNQRVWKEVISRQCEVLDKFRCTYCTVLKIISLKLATSESRGRSFFRRSKHSTISSNTIRVTWISFSWEIARRKSNKIFYVRWESWRGIVANLFLAKLISDWHWNGTYRWLIANLIIFSKHSYIHAINPLFKVFIVQCAVCSCSFRVTGSLQKMRDPIHTNETRSVFAVLIFL